jgi:hypothetical protein
MVQIDLALPKFASLIESARRIILSNGTAEHNHTDLATGAFIEHVRKREYSSTRTLHVEPAEHAPMTAPIASAGGSAGYVRCSIWEEEKFLKIKEAGSRFAEVVTQTSAPFARSLAGSLGSMR